MLGQTLEGTKSKNVSQNSKIMFRTKITAKSISHINYFSLLLQKKAYNFGTKPFKRSVIRLACKIVYQTLNMPNIT